MSLKVKAIKITNSGGAAAFFQISPTADLEVSGFQVRSQTGAADLYCKQSAPDTAPNPSTEAPIFSLLQAGQETRYDGGARNHRIGRGVFNLRDFWLNVNPAATIIVTYLAG